MHSVSRACQGLSSFPWTHRGANANLLCHLLRLTYVWMQSEQFCFSILLYVRGIPVLISCSTITTRALIPNAERRRPFQCKV
jgi:hypothetical protein